MMTTALQFLRYAAIGLSANFLAYLAYLGVTGVGLPPKIAMTVIYLCCTLLTFHFNRAWSFRHEGGIRGAFFRYISTYLLGYLFNLAALFLLVDELGLDHRIVQGVLILVVAMMIFTLQKFWVFAGSSGGGQLRQFCAENSSKLEKRSR